MATQNIFDLTDTWNAGATTFTAVKMNVTDTASAAGSMLIDLQHNSTSLFHILKNGAVHSKRSNYNITNANSAVILVSNYGAWPRHNRHHDRRTRRPDSGCGKRRCRRKRSQ
jgi:hypothetical protein